MNSDPLKPTVLIVDDDAETVKMIARLLKDKYTPIGATGGNKALEIAGGENRPDLILLDILMPNLDGYEVCRRLKADERTRHIPVIFVTSMSETEDEAKGFEVGAVDYIVKPVNPKILQIRVHTHLELKRHRDQLEELSEKRAKQMVHAERLASIGTLSSGIAHEISTYLFYITDNTEKLKASLDECLPFLTEHTKGDLDQPLLWEKITRNFPQWVSAIREGIRRIETVIQSMKQFSQQDMETQTAFRIEDCIENAINLCQNSLKRHVIIQKGNEEELPKFFGNVRQIEQVFINVFKNAAEAMDIFGKGTLEVSVGKTPFGIRITIEDTGVGIPEDKLDAIWQPFFTTKVGSAGLGLSTSKGIIENHHGKIWAENREGRGARLMIELPIK